MDGRMDGRTEGRAHGQAESNMPLQLWKSLGHKKCVQTHKNYSPGKRPLY